MQSYHLGQPGDVNSLALRTHDDPKPGPGHVLVRLRAAALNYRDIMILEGRYGYASFTPGRIPLSDGAGEVVTLGEDVIRLRLRCDCCVDIGLPSDRFRRCLMLRRRWSP